MLERALALITRLEGHYAFECPGGPLRNCTAWLQLKALFAPSERVSRTRDNESSVVDTGAIKSVENDVRIVVRELEDLVSARSFDHTRERDDNQLTEAMKRLRRWVGYQA